MLVVWGYWHKLRQPFTKPYSDIAVHVDSKGFVAFLQTTYGEVFQGADMFTKVNPPSLAHTQTAHRDETFGKKYMFSS